MNDPQAWTLIGVFAAVMLGGMTLMTTQFSRVIRAEVGGLRGEMRGEIGELRGEISSLRTDIAGVESRLTTRIDTLDHEVANLAKRIWREND